VNGYAIATSRDISVRNEFDRPIRPPWVPEPVVTHRYYAFYRCEFTDSVGKFAEWFASRELVRLGFHVNERLFGAEDLRVVNYLRDVGNGRAQYELVGQGVSVVLTTDAPPPELDTKSALLPAAGPWIAVAERLPEEMVRVLFCGPTQVDHRNRLRILSGWLHAGMWCSPGTQYGDDITHWAEVREPEGA
jgi:hypothetical protein